MISAYPLGVLPINFFACNLDRFEGGLFLFGFLLLYSVFICLGLGAEFLSVYPRIVSNSWSSCLSLEC